MKTVQKNNHLVSGKRRSILIRVVLFAAFLFVLTQCTVISFYPLYTKNELIRDDRIIGTWMSKEIDEEVSKDSLVWEISFKDKKWDKNKDKTLTKENKHSLKPYTYQLKIYPYSNPDDLTEFDIHIVKLDNQYYLDFLLDDFNYESDVIFYSFHILPVHTFAKLEIGDEIRVKWLDGDFLEDLLKENKIRIKHEQRKDNSLLTARPKELQKFIIKYANHPKAYNEDLSFDLSLMNKVN